MFSIVQDSHWLQKVSAEINFPKRTVVVSDSISIRYTWCYRIDVYGFASTMQLEHSL